MALCLLSALPQLAQADVCRSSGTEPGVPIRVPLGPRRPRQLPEVCPATAVALASGVSALIATDEFYGALAASTGLVLRLTVTENSWLSATPPGLDYLFSANATVEASRLETSGASLGYHVSFRLPGEVRISPYAKLLLPFESAYAHARRFGTEWGASAAWQWLPSLHLLGGVSVPLLITDGGGEPLVDFVPQITLDVEYRPLVWLSAVGGLGVRTQWGDHAGFEAVDVRGALRGAFGSGGSAELYADLGVALPAFGNDRTDLAASLDIGCRWR